MTFRVFVCAVAIVAAGLGPGCGNDEGSSPVDPLLNKVDEARDVQAKSSVRIAVTTANLIYSEQGGFAGGAGELAQALGARDSSVRYTTGPSTAAGVVQVVGGGAEPVMFVARSASGNYSAAWLAGAGEVLYYLGAAPPTYSTTPPSGDGWSTSP